MNTEEIKHIRNLVLADMLNGNDKTINGCILRKLDEQLTTPVVSKRLGVNSKVCLKKHKNITGVVVDSSDVGFNHWMVKWDRTGETVREYGSDLVVC